MITIFNDPEGYNHYPRFAAGFRYMQTGKAGLSLPRISLLDKIRELRNTTGSVPHILHQRPLSEKQYCTIAVRIHSAARKSPKG